MRAPARRSRKRREKGVLSALTPAPTLARRQRFAPLAPPTARSSLGRTLTPRPPLPDSLVPRSGEGELERGDCPLSTPLPARDGRPVVGELAARRSGVCGRGEEAGRMRSGRGA